MDEMAQNGCERDGIHSDEQYTDDLVLQEQPLSPGSGQNREAADTDCQEPDGIVHQEPDRIVHQEPDGIVPVETAKESSSSLVLPSNDAECQAQDGSCQEQESRYQRILLNTWIPEILAITLSTGCLIAIFAVLYAYNGQTLPRLPYGITLNALVAILATASRTLMIFVVTAAIGQLKWHWFQTSRKLHDLQTYDDASRGPSGALVLIFSLRARPVASLGAIIMVLVLAFDPFVQQILHYPERRVTSFLGVPTIKLATSFNVGAESIEMLNALQGGVWTTPEQYAQQPGCPTTECSWDNYTSVGWCYTCADATMDAVFTGCGSDKCSVRFGHAARFPVINSLAGANQTVNISTQGGFIAMHNPIGIAKDVTFLWDTDALYNSSHRTSLLGATNPVLALGHVSLAVPGVGTGPFVYNVTKAEKCVVSLCERNMATTFMNGSAETKVLRTNYGSITTDSLQCPENGTHIATCWHPSKPSGVARNVTCHFNPFSLIGNSKYIVGTFTGIDDSGPFFCVQGLGFHEQIAGISYSYPKGPHGYGSAISTQLEGNCSAVYNRTSTGVIIFDSIGNIVSCSSPTAQNIATNGLEKVLASITASLTKLGLETSGKDVQGRSIASEVYVNVRWEWLILPSALAMGAILLLLWAIVRSRRLGLKPWKSSILPVLYHGLEPEQLSRQSAPEEVTAMTRLAKQVNVRLMQSLPNKKSTLKVA